MSDSEESNDEDEEEDGKEEGDENEDEGEEKKKPQQRGDHGEAPGKLEDCQLVVGDMALNKFILLPLLGVYLILLFSSIYSIQNHYQLIETIKNTQCSLDMKTLSKVESSYWEEWTEYSECTVTCGNGVRSHSRTCILSSLKNPKNCEGEERETAECLDQPVCYIPSSWTEWTEFGLCSVTCETGEHSRTRTCKFPSGEEASDCEGEGKETVECAGVKENCPINGGWNEWSSWSECSLTCGHGEEVRSRTCTHPEPLWDGAECEGSGEELKTCILTLCVGQSSWSMWEDDTGCSVTCGTGIYTRVRTCEQPENVIATPCEGHSSETAVCTGSIQEKCPINGGWNEWTLWSDCSVTCGNGVKRITRTCDNPEPQYGGDNCEGNEEATTLCSLTECIGDWNPWGEWASCQQTPCEAGVKRRERTCNPSNCIGSSTSTQACVVGCPAMDFNNYYVESAVPLERGNEPSKQYVFISAYMQIPFNATIRKAIVFTLTHSHPFYLSFWKPTSDYKGRSKESFDLKKKHHVLTRRSGYMAIDMEVCVEKGWYVGIHYDVNGRNRWSSQTNGVIGFKKFEVNEPSDCVNYVKHAYDSNWPLEKTIEFKRSTHNICPAIILRLHCIGCHFINLNSYFYDSIASFSIDNKDHSIGTTQIRTTAVYMSMVFSLDGHVYQLKYNALSANEDMFLQFYEPEERITNYPKKRKFILKKVMPFRTKRIGLNTLETNFSFKKGWIIGMSYPFGTTGNGAVIGWAELLNSAYGSAFYGYRTVNLYNDWEIGTVVEMQRGTKRSPLFIARIKYDC